MKPFQLDRRAAKELEEAAAWYDERHLGLGDRLLSEFDQLVLEVRDHPSSFLRIHGLPADLPVRWGAVPTFPYRLLCLELEESIQGVAVSHVRRKPGYWIPRVLVR